jgi:phosphotransferase system enzyme I (PtsI)
VGGGIGAFVFDQVVDEGLLQRLGLLVEAELRRLRKARDAVAQELEQLKLEMPEDAPQELSALLDVHLLLLHDVALTEPTAQWVIERHYNAEWALSAQLEVLARQFDEMEDDYLRERKADVEQVVERVLGAMQEQFHGKPVRLPSETVKDWGGDEPLVLIAADISPADMLHFKRSVFQGFVTDVGGKTSHTAIVARSMDIPAVVGAREASRLIRQDDWVIIDGDAGVVIVDPSPIVLEEYRFRQRQMELERQKLARLRHTPAVSIDGEAVELLANIEMPEDTEAVHASGAVGVGLFRSEFLFMNREGELPGEEEQYQAYKRAVEGMKGLPLTIRTVDVGADKPLDRLSINELRHEHVLNPAMGLRAIRWSLSEPDMFLEQLRALLRAAALGPVQILIPMLAHLREMRQVRQMLLQAERQLDAQGLARGSVQLGAMIEIPAAALMVDRLLQDFDFISIGTNDLIQYTLAIDRADESVAHLYDGWHPAVLDLIHRSIAAANRVGKKVSVCGEMAGDAAYTRLLLSMGLRSFSMHPTQVATIKQIVLRSDTRKLGAQCQRVLSSDDPQAASACLA